jgi:hypothetical protein
MTKEQATAMMEKAGLVAPRIIIHRGADGSVWFDLCAGPANARRKERVARSAPASEIAAAVERLA